MTPIHFLKSESKVSLSRGPLSFSIPEGPLSLSLWSFLGSAAHLGNGVGQAVRAVPHHRLSPLLERLLFSSWCRLHGAGFRIWGKWLKV